MPDEARVSLPKGDLFPKGWWGRPRLGDRKQGETSRESMYATVGHALSNWVEVEDKFAQLLLYMCIDQNTLFVSQYIDRIFGSIENMGGRIKAFEAAAAIYFFPYWEISVVKKTMKLLLSEIEKASHRRNDIAHGRVVSVKSDAIEFDENGLKYPETDEYDASGFMLVAPEHMTWRNTHYYEGLIHDDPLARFRSEYRLNAKDILLFGYKFSLLKNEINRFHFLIQRTSSTDEPRLIKLLKTEYPQAFRRPVR